jgi:penicillin-binding protein 2
LFLISWRLLRPEMWTARTALPLGFLSDLVSGHPIGQSMALWTITFLLLDLVESRAGFKDYWLDWLLAALLVLAYTGASWFIAKLMGSEAAFSILWPQIVLSILFYPVGRPDRRHAGSMAAHPMRRRAAPLLTEKSQVFTFTRRSFVLGAAQGGVAALLAARMAYISIAENERYQLLSESNRVQMQLLPPRRGWIIDRYGKPMAINRSDFRVDLIPDRLKEPDRVLAELARLLELPPEEIERIKKELEQAGRLPAGGGGREYAVREICGRHDPPAGAAGRQRAELLLPLLSRRRGSRAPDRLCRARPTARNMKRRTRPLSSSRRASRSARKALKRRWSKGSAASPAPAARK